MACNKRQHRYLFVRNVAKRCFFPEYMDLKEKKGTLRIYIVLNAKMLKSLKNINTKKVTET